MKLSTRARYGIRAMLELAQNEGKGPMQIKRIGQHQEISVKYLEQGGFVRSMRGAKGGYMLSEVAAKIKLSDVFNCLEGPLITTECLEDNEYCHRAADCVTRELWAEVQNAVKTVLDSFTLQDLVDRAKNKKDMDYQI
jgi:Rrf2 family protein